MHAFLDNGKSPTAKQPAKAERLVTAGSGAGSAAGVVPPFPRPLPLDDLHTRDKASFRFGKGRALAEDSD